MAGTGIGSQSSMCSSIFFLNMLKNIIHHKKHITILSCKSFLQHFENSNLNDYWGPKISVQNVIDSKKKKVLKELNFTPNGEAFITEKRKISGHFSEKLELMDFPFDHQVCY